MGERSPIQQEVCQMIRQSECEQLNSLTDKILDQVFVMRAKGGLGCSQFEAEAPTEFVKKGYFPWLPPPAAIQADQMHPMAATWPPACCHDWTLTNQQITAFRTHPTACPANLALVGRLPTDCEQYQGKDLVDRIRTSVLTYDIPQSYFFSHNRAHRNHCSRQESESAPCNSGQVNAWI